MVLITADCDILQRVGRCAQDRGNVCVGNVNVTQNTGISSAIDTAFAIGIGSNAAFALFSKAGVNAR